MDKKCKICKIPERMKVKDGTYKVRTFIVKRPKRQRFIYAQAPRAPVAGNFER
jgi:hypothetical protein